MGDLSKHFSRSEFQCTGCRGKICPQGYNNGNGYSVVDVQLLEMLEHLRVHFGQPIKVNSGFRCVERNAEVGGASSSKHMHGMAADIVVSGVEPGAVYRYLDTRWNGGLGNYPSFTHLDTRPYKVRF